MNINDKKRGFKIFDYQRDGKGVSKATTVKESGLLRFFTSFRDNFSKILTVNIIMVLCNFPIFFLVAVLSGFTKAETYLPSGDLFQNLGGLYLAEDISPFMMTLYALEGLPNQVLVNTTLTYVFIGVGALVLFTFGPVNAGTAYIFRNFAMGEPVFVWSDFWYALKRNIKQALPIGVADILINGLLAFNIYTTMSSDNFLTSFMFWSNIVVMLLFFTMRPYIYIQLVSFNFRINKIVKNSLIFTIIGFKRNAIALLGCAVCVALELLLIFGAQGLLISLGVGLPLLIMFSAMAYMKVYAAYFKIKEIIIDPYMLEHPEEFAADEPEEAIMHDDVTERERLDEIKKRNGLI